MEVYVSRTDLLALCSLTELRKLCIEKGASEEAADADMAALCSPLQKLRRLVLEIGMPRLSPSVLRAMGGALPRLWDLQLCGEWYLGPALDGGTTAVPLFPSLQYFDLLIYTNRATANDNRFVKESKFSSMFVKTLLHESLVIALLLLTAPSKRLLKQCARHVFWSQIHLNCASFMSVAAADSTTISCALSRSLQCLLDSDWRCVCGKSRRKRHPSLAESARWLFQRQHFNER
jgi:hypothetical protein